MASPLPRSSGSSYDGWGGRLEPIPPTIWGGSEATGRDHWERHNDVFEATIQAALAVFILSTAVAVISPRAVAWRGALGGPLLLLLAAFPTFLIFTVKAIRVAVGTNEPPEQH